MLKSESRGFIRGFAMNSQVGLPHAGGLLGSAASFEEAVELLNLAERFGPLFLGDFRSIPEFEGVAAADKSQAAEQHFALMVAQIERHRLAHARNIH